MCVCVCVMRVVVGGIMEGECSDCVIGSSLALGTHVTEMTMMIMMSDDDQYVYM